MFRFWRNRRAWQQQWDEEYDRQRVVSLLPEPWRDHTDRVITLPCAMLLADFNRLRQINNSDRVALGQMKADILANGIRESLLIIYDDEGAAMKDGHHRTLIAQEHGIYYLPVTWQRVPKIARRRQSWQDIFDRMSRDLFTAISP